MSSRSPSGNWSRRDFLLPLAVIALVGLLTWGWVWLSRDDPPVTGPRVTVGKYMAAMRNKDVKTAQDLLCSALEKDKEDVAERIRRFRSLNYEIGESTKKSDTEYVVNVEVDAVVNLAGDDTQSTTTYVLKMVKEADGWRVCGITG